MPKKRPRASCHPERSHYAKGLCRACYQGPRRRGNYPRRRNAEYHRRRYLRKQYGITVEEFESIALAQGGRCVLCGMARKLVVDHCHVTGAIRALLCDPCNRMLGEAGENPSVLRAGAAYLEHHVK